MTKQLEHDYIAGLLLERDGAIQSRNKAHLAEIDAELRRAGYKEGDVIKSESPTWKARQANLAELETATVEPAAEKATVHRRKPAKAAKPRKATPAEETAIAATVKAEADAKAESADERHFFPGTIPGEDV